MRERLKLWGGKGNFYVLIASGGGHMRLSTKLVLSFAGIICVILAISGSSIFSTLKMNDRFRNVENSYFPALSAVDDMHLNFWTIRSNLSAMLLARQTSAAATYDARITESLRNIAEQRKNYLDCIGVFSPQDLTKANGLLVASNAGNGHRLAEKFGMHLRRHAGGGNNLGQHADGPGAQADYVVGGAGAV